MSRLDISASEPSCNASITARESAVHKHCTPWGLNVNTNKSSVNSRCTSRAETRATFPLSHGGAAIQIDTVGRITSGGDVGKFVRIQKLPDESPPSFLILVAHDQEFHHGYGDYWVEDYESLEEFLAEGQWVIEWLDPAAATAESRQRKAGQFFNEDHGDSR